MIGADDPLDSNFRVNLMPSMNKTTAGGPEMEPPSLSGFGGCDTQDPATSAEFANNPDGLKSLACPPPDASTPEGRRTTSVVSSRCLEPSAAQKLPARMEMAPYPVSGSAAYDYPDQITYLSHAGGPNFPIHPEKDQAVCSLSEAFRPAELSTASSASTGKSPTSHTRISEIEPTQA